MPPFYHARIRQRIEVSLQIQFAAFSHSRLRSGIILPKNTYMDRKPPTLEPGRVYRTREFAVWSSNPPRFARRLARAGVLRALAHGLYSCPRTGGFGEVPPTDAELMRAFLEDSAHVFTGPHHWNALGLGTTALFAMPVVYNTKRSGVFEFAGRRFLLRRVAFPPSPSPEWYVVDLFEHADAVGTSRSELATALAHRVRAGAFDTTRLRGMASRYGTRQTRNAVDAALAASAA
jgi:hypothetical protein